MYRCNMMCMHKVCHLVHACNTFLWLETKEKSKLISFIMACDTYSLGLTSGGPVSVMCCSLLGTCKLGR